MKHFIILIFIFLIKSSHGQEYNIDLNYLFSNNIYVFSNDIHPIPSLFSETKLKYGNGVQLNAAFFVTKSLGIRIQGSNTWYSSQFNGKLIGTEIEQIKITEKAIINTLSVGLDYVFYNKSRFKLKSFITINLHDLKSYEVWIDFINSNRSPTKYPNNTNLKSRISTSIGLSPSYSLYKSSKKGFNMYLSTSASLGYSITNFQNTILFPNFTFGVGFIF